MRSHKPLVQLGEGRAGVPCGVAGRACIETLWQEWTLYDSDGEQIGNGRDDHWKSCAVGEWAIRPRVANVPGRRLDSLELLQPLRVVHAKGRILRCSEGTLPDKLGAEETW